MKNRKQKVCGIASIIIICSMCIIQLVSSEFKNCSDTSNEHIRTAGLSEIKIVQTEKPIQTEYVSAKTEHQKGYILLSNSRVSVYKSPSEESNSIDNIETDLCVDIIESTEQWYKILYEADKSGYVLKKDITFDKQKATIALNEIIQATNEQINNNNVCEYSYTAPELNPKGEDIINTAKKFLGTKYVYGGTTPAGFDCSGLVKYVCASLGINVNRTAAAQFNNGKAVNKNDLMPGDLLFFAKNGRIHHVGIYAGNGEMIHAPQSGDVVKYSSINTPYRQKEFVGARRVY